MCQPSFSEKDHRPTTEQSNTMSLSVPSTDNDHISDYTRVEEANNVTDRQADTHLWRQYGQKKKTRALSSATYCVMTQHNSIKPNGWNSKPVRALVTLLALQLPFAESAHFRLGHLSARAPVHREPTNTHTNGPTTINRHGLSKWIQNEESKNKKQTVRLHFW